MLSNDGDDPIVTGGFGAVQSWLFDREESDGQTRVQKWEAEGWPEFTQDEQRLLRFRATTELTLIEMVKVEADHATRVRDLLDPNREDLIVFDFTLASHFVPFQVILTHTLQLPHLCSIEGNDVGVDPKQTADLIAYVRKRSGSNDPAEQKRWWGLNAPEVASEHERLLSEGHQRI